MRRLRRLELGGGTIALEPLSGGLSNHNFAVHAGGESYVVRLCDERPLLGIDRRNEVACQHAASQLRVAPEVIHHESGLLLSRFIAGRALEPARVREPAQLARLADLLRALHSGWDTVTGALLHFCAFRTVRTYAATAKDLRANLPCDIATILDDVRELSRQIGPYHPVLCHNDLMPGNLIDDGERLWLVDWEYSGMGHPLFDLANAAANGRFSDDDDRALLAAYDSDAGERALGELRIFKAVSCLRESLWGTIQLAVSEIEFDYRTYAGENLDAYRRALNRLKGL